MLQKTSPIQFVDLSELHFGHECPTGNINSRRSDRDRDVPKLARNLAIFGLIYPLIVKRVDGKTYVAAGNRRLAALQWLNAKKGTESPGNIELGRIPTINMDASDGLEISMVENTEREPLHPVDRYRVFSSLRDDGGLTVDQIAARHGISRAKVEQALALGALAPEVLDAWAAGGIDAEAAKAFTLVDKAAQKKTLAKLRKQGDHMIGAYEVKREIGARDGAAAAKYVNFVGVDAYEAAGGKLTRDLFGGNHIVHDPKIAVSIAQDKLMALCDDAVARGWKWAMTSFDAPSNAIMQWQQLPGEKKATKAQADRLKILDEETFDEDGDEERIRLDRVEHRDIENEIDEAAHKPIARARAGCIMSVSDDGGLIVTCGLVKPEDEVAARKSKAKGAKAGDQEDAEEGTPAGKGAKAAAKPSNALLTRLAQQLAEATRAALIAERREVKSDNLFTVLTSLVAGMIEPGRMNWTPQILQKTMAAIREAVSPKIMNEALRKAFDAADYFASVPKPMVIKAIKECSPEMVGSAGFASKAKGDLAKLAVKQANLSKWLPPELRTPHYDGPSAGKPAKKKRR